MSQYTLGQKARTALIIEFPFYGMLALRLQMHEVDDIPNFPLGLPQTACTDGTRLWINNAWYASLTPAQRLGIFMHEVLHCVMDHMGRRNGRNVRKWQRATDYAINPLILGQVGLRGTKVDLPPGLWDDQFKDMSAEEIYAKLPDGQEPEKWICGLQDADDGKQEEVRAEWTIAVTNAATAAAAQGALPANMKRFIDELVAPKVDWRDQLRRFFGAFAQDDFVWHRPNRRFAHMGIFLPSSFSERVGHVKVVIDTSGSISQPILTAFGSEISDIHRRCKPEKLTVVYADDRVNHVDVFGPHDELVFNMHGGGGTDFRPAFKPLGPDDTEPVVLVYLTDGYGTFPAEAPPFTTIWAMTTDVQPPWGERVEVEVEA